MPRTCLACASLERAAIDKALVAGEPLRNIAKRVSISPAGLLRHKAHLSEAVVKADERRKERLGENLLDEMRGVQRKAWELLDKTECEGEHRGAIVALREVRECLGALGELLGKVQAEAGLQGPNKFVVEFVSPEGKPMRRDVNGLLKVDNSNERDRETERRSSCDWRLLGRGEKGPVA